MSIVNIEDGSLIIHNKNMLGYNCIGVGDKEYVIKTLWDCIFERLNF